MKVSLIICTLRRNDELAEILKCLSRQSHENLEVLVVDGSDNGGVRAVVESVNHSALAEFRHLHSARGLTRQRNAGLETASGEIIGFLDDDVRVEKTFVERIVEVFESDHERRIVGLTGYDTCNYPRFLSLRWKMRRWLGIVPTLELGNVDRYGRPVPLSFRASFEGLLDIGWLPGFCMFYRRDAIQDLRFDETLPTYAGEDRDFSLTVGERGRLVMKGDLLIEHRSSATNRPSPADRVYQTGFGVGRGIAKRSRGLLGQGVVWQTILGECIIDGLSVLRHPSFAALASVWARAKGIYHGWQSYTHPQARRCSDSAG